MVAILWVQQKQKLGGGGGGFGELGARWLECGGGGFGHIRAVARLRRASVRSASSANPLGSAAGSSCLKFQKILKSGASRINIFV